MVSYYKSKEILARQTKDWLVEYSEAIDNETPPPEWSEFCRKQLMQFGFGRKMMDKFLREEFDLKVTKENKLEKVGE